MGNTLAEAGMGMRVTLFATLVLSISIATAAFFTPLKNLFSSYSIQYYTYVPAKTVLSAVDTSGMPPAIAVPILMYHGVNDHLDEVNTTIDNFISHMEMLKRNGYATISVAEYDLWRQGKFILPPKPIIITFDDGRKDSYYTTDDVLKKLGFKATIFVATGPAYDANPFYLDWEELRQMKSSGRWEIEAHGRYSHHKIQIAKGATADIQMGRYLTSKLYLPDENRIETDAEFKERVEGDYVSGLNDLRVNVGVNPHYFSIPLNDYGQQPISNYVGAVPFNQELIRKYFKLAFIQANSSDDVSSIHLPVYNYKSDSSYLTKRIEVKNMSTQLLEMVLNDQAPRPPALNLTPESFSSATLIKDFFSGTMRVVPEGLELQAAEIGENGQVVFGEQHWQNYQARASIERTAGRSASLLFYVKDGKNYMSFGLSDNSFYLRATVDGKTIDLAPPRPAGVSQYGSIAYGISVKDGKVTCSINGLPIYSGVTVPVSNGAVGVRVWSDITKGAGIVGSLEVKSL